MKRSIFKKGAYIPSLFLVAIMLVGCSFADEKTQLPIEMIAFNSLTDEEEDRIPVSPKDSTVKKVTVDSEIKPFLNNDYNKEKVYRITFHHTETASSGPLVVFMDLDKKIVVGKAVSE